MKHVLVGACAACLVASAFAAGACVEIAGIERKTPSEDAGLVDAAEPSDDAPTTDDGARAD